MFAPRLDPPVNNICFYFAKTEIRLYVCFRIVILKNCPSRFSHNFTVLSWINYPR